MTEWKVGDKVEVLEFGHVIGVSEVAEITEGGGVRLKKDADATFREDLSNKRKMSWACYYIRKITDEEFATFLRKKELKIKCAKVISRLTSIKDEELLNYEQSIEIFYDKLIEGNLQ